MTRRDALNYLLLGALMLATSCVAGISDTYRAGYAHNKDKHTVAVEEWEEAEEPELASLGRYTVYAYCSCPKCCGQWSGGPTASGTMPEAGRTAAADWSVLPAGTELYIDGLGWRVVEDTGSGIAGDKLDLYMDSHESALAWGVKELEVYTYAVQD